MQAHLRSTSSKGKLFVIILVSVLVGMSCQSLSPSPTETPTIPVNADSYDLLIVKRGEDSLFLVNQGDEAFPMGPLLLGEGDGAIMGVDWGLDELAPGECVTVWKDKGNPKAPDVACVEVGEQLERSGPDRFWRSTFEVFYNDELVATCDKEQTECEVSIPK